MTLLTIDRRDSTNPEGFNIVLDASLTERHARSIEVTRHPVERGAAVADHAREGPLRLSIEGLFTNTHQNTDTQFKRAGNSAPGESGFAEQMADLLETLLLARRLVTVETAFRRYTDMMLSSLEVPRDSSVGDAVRFSAVFEQVRFVETEVSTTDTRFAATPRDKQKPVKRVEQPKKTSPEVKDPPTNRSVLKKITDYSGLTKAGSGVLP